jgi:hypothetical protein
VYWTSAISFNQNLSQKRSFALWLLQENIQQADGIAWFAKWEAEEIE